jgi:hypothetical protein
VLHVRVKVLSRDLLSIHNRHDFGSLPFAAGSDKESTRHDGTDHDSKRQFLFFQIHHPRKITSHLMVPARFKAGSAD